MSRTNHSYPLLKENNIMINAHQGIDAEICDGVGALCIELFILNL